MTRSSLSISSLRAGEMGIPFVASAVAVLEPDIVAVAEQVLAVALLEVEPELVADTEAVAVAVPDTAVQVVGTEVVADIVAVEPQKALRSNI